MALPPRRITNAELAAKGKLEPSPSKQLKTVNELAKQDAINTVMRITFEDIPDFENKLRLIRDTNFMWYLEKVVIPLLKMSDGSRTAMPANLAIFYGGLQPENIKGLIDLGDNG